MIEEKYGDRENSATSGHLNSNSKSVLPYPIFNGDRGDLVSAFEWDLDWDVPCQKSSLPIDELEFDPLQEKKWKNILNRSVENDYDKYNHMENRRETMLHNAIRFNNLSLIEWMVKEEVADIDECNNKGLTPLHFSILYRKEAITSILLKQKADMSIADVNGENSLHTAAGTLPMPYLTSILDYCDENLMNTPSKAQKYPIHYLVENKNANAHAVHIFIEKGAKINSNGHPPEMSSLKKRQVGSPLHYFIRLKSDNMSLLQGLLECGADANALNENGITPLNLILLRESNVETMARLLLTFGGNVNGTSPNGKSFFEKLEQKYLRDLQWRLRGETHLEISDCSGNTPLHLVTATGNDTLTKLFLEYGADINIDNYLGYTPGYVSRIAYRENQHNENIRAVFITLFKHVLALRFSRKYITRTNERILTNIRFRILRESRKQYLQEIGLLQKHIINGTDFSLEFILRLNYIGGRSSSEILIQGIKKENFMNLKSLYPMFYPILRRSLEKIVHLNQLENLIRNICSDFMLLPIICVDKILNFLNNETIKNLIEAFSGADHRKPSPPKN